MKKDKITYLHITTWSGKAFMASHYYGKLYYEDSSFELCRELTKKQADELNNKDATGCIGFYHAGDMTQRFDTRKDVIKAAKKQYKKYFPCSNLLVLGNPTDNDVL